MSRDSVLSKAAQPLPSKATQPVTWVLVAAADLPTLTARVGLVFGRTSQPATLLSEEHVEAMAAHAHQRYVEQQQGGNATGSVLAEQGWEQLSTFAKESNRAQVRDIPVKLASARRRLVAAPGADGPDTGPPDASWLSAEVVERLAEWEHRRSFSQHRCAGYTSAAATDHSRREHAMLVSYAELTEEQRELDRSAVRSIPHLLAAVGLATAPLETAHTPTTGSPTDADHSDLRLIDLPRLPQRA